MIPLSTTTYGVSAAQREEAVELIVRRGIDKENAWSVILSASKMLAFLLGGLFFTIANQYPVIRAWLLAPFGAVTFILAVFVGLYLLFKSNQKTRAVSELLPAAGLHTAKDDAGQWWVIRRSSGEAEPLNVRDDR